MHLASDTSSLRSILCGIAVALAIAVPASAQVTLARTPEAITVEIDGRPFTSLYIGGDNLNRVYLHPLRAATGTIVNRSFPAGQVEGETVDHPHHAGLFYGHGDVNGFNFWAIQNVATPPDPTMGRIVLKKVDSMVSGARSGSLGVVLDWLEPDGTPLLIETRRMTFHADPELRIIDVDLDLEAVEKAVFGDTKEGTFAFRMATALEEPNPKAKPEAAGAARTGRLLNAEGGEGEANVWGKPSKWVDYSGRIGDERVGVVMMDHPDNPRHPTYWHSRGYGLHAINPFGLHDFLNDKSQDGSLTLQPGEHVRFRYRVVIHPEANKARLDQLYAEYAGTTAPAPSR